MAGEPTLMQITSEEYERLKPFLYHVVSATDQMHMAEVRAQYAELAVLIMRNGPPTRSKSLALTHLEDALMRTIQDLALTGEPQLPPGFEVLG